MQSGEESSSCGCFDPVGCLQQCSQNNMVTVLYIYMYKSIPISRTSFL